MASAYTGRCACDAVELAVEGEPIAVGQCWCRQCQRIAAGSPGNSAVFMADQVTVSGAVASHSYLAESGNTATQSFCPSCGIPILGQTSIRSSVVAVKLGVLDQPHGLRPSVVMWVSEAPDWAVIDPALPQFPKLPPMPGEAETSE